MSLKRPLLLCISLVVLAGAVYGGYFLASRKTDYKIPDSILQQVSFPVLSQDPANKTWHIESSLSSYNSSEGVLTLHFKSTNSSIIMTEQATPSAFGDIQDYYTDLLGKLREYAQVQTGAGTVALTHPVELNGGQSAVLNTGQTLIFAHPTNALSQNTWTNFFNTLSVVR
jgi:hypothetical protein